MGQPRGSEHLSFCKVGILPQTSEPRRTTPFSDEIQALAGTLAAAFETEQKTQQTSAHTPDHQNQETLGTCQEFSSTKFVVTVFKIL